MSENLHTDDAENTPEADDEVERPYADAEGEPLRCPDCGEFVAIHYRPQEEYAIRSAGFYAHCDCTLGPELSKDNVEHLAPKWFAELVLETEEDGEYWLDYYTHDNRSLRKWVDVPTTTKREEQDIVEALQAAKYGDQIGVETESCEVTGAVVGTCTVEENGMEDQTFTVSIEIKESGAPWKVANLRWGKDVDGVRLHGVRSGASNAEEVESIEVLSEE